MSQTSQFERERAKRLKAAMISSRMETSFQTEYRHIGDGPIEPFWYWQAEEVERAFAEEVGKVMAPTLEREKVQ
jgi:hypothetical protein